MPNYNKCCLWNQYGRDILKVAILAVIKNSPSHGYSVLSDLEELGFSVSKYHPSIIYRVLRNLEHEALVESQWQISGVGPARRIYKITPKGEEYLKQWVLKSKDYMGLIERLTDFIQKGG